MSVKGFFIALACVGLGTWGFIVSITHILSNDASLMWILILAFSFLAMFFGMGVFSTKIKL